MSKQVVVVGAGLSGLMCATLLARVGFGVQVLEKASRSGGRALSPAVHGVPMNLGAHALYLGGPAERVLRTLGVDFTGGKPSASDAWLCDAEGLFASPTSIFSLATATRFSLKERFALLRFFARLDGLDPASVAGKTTTAWLDGSRHPQKTRRFIDAMVRVSTYSNAPELVPAEIALRQLQIAVGLKAKGVVYVDRGWQSLVSQLEDAATAAGVRIVTDAHVTRVSRGGRVQLEGSDGIDADHVVVALTHGAACHVVPSLGHVPREPVRAACVDLVLSAPPPRRLVIGLDEPHYFSVHSAPNAAPVCAHALRYLAPHERGEEQRAALEAWLDRVVYDGEGFRSHVVGQRFLPEMDVSSAFPSRQELPVLDRISFVGDWTSKAHVLLDAAAESAEAACVRVRAPDERAHKAA